MRKLLVLLFAAALSAPYCAANGWVGWTSAATATVVPQNTSAPAVVSSSVANTTSPYNGFTAASTPTTSYSGALTTMSSGGGGWSSWGSAGQTATNIVSNTTTSGVNWMPQSTQPTTSVGSYSGGYSTSGWSSWGSPYQMMSQPSNPGAPSGSNSSNAASSYGSYGASFDNPEPGTILTLVGGMGALVLWRRRMLRKNAK